MKTSPRGPVRRARIGREAATTTRKDTRMAIREIRDLYEEDEQQRPTLAERVGVLEEQLKRLLDGHEKTGDAISSGDIRLSRIEKEIGLIPRT